MQLNQSGKCIFIQTWKDCNHFGFEWKMQSYVSYDLTFGKSEAFLWHGTESD